MLRKLPLRPPPELFRAKICNLYMSFMVLTPAGRCRPAYTRMKWNCKKENMGIQNLICRALELRQAQVMRKVGMTCSRLAMVIHFPHESESLRLDGGGGVCIMNDHSAFEFRTGNNIL